MVRAWRSLANRRWSTHMALPPPQKKGYESATSAFICTFLNKLTRQGGWHGCSDRVNPRISMPTTTTITAIATTTTTMTASATTTAATYCKPLLMSFQQRLSPSPCYCRRGSLEPDWGRPWSSRPPGSWRSRTPWRSLHFYRIRSKCCPTCHQLRSSSGWIPDLLLPAF